MNCINPRGISFINNSKNYYSNKLIKMNTKCISHNICNAENTINNAYKYLTIIYEYLQQIKEELDGLFKSDVPYCKLQSVLKIMEIYVKEIDYIISEAIYDNKNLIVSPDDTDKEIKFLFAFPYNYKHHYPIGVPMTSAVNNYIFTYICPIINSIVLGLDVVLYEFLIKKNIITVNSTIVPEKGTLVRSGSGVGVFIENTENVWTIDVFYNYDLFVADEEITNIDKDITYASITTIEDVTNIMDYKNYTYLNVIVCYLQYITDTAVKSVWDDIDKISYYLFICEINSKLLRTYSIY